MKNMRKLLLAIMLATFLPMAGSEIVIQNGAIVKNVVEIKGVYYYIYATGSGSYNAMVIASPSGYSGHLDIPAYISVPAHYDTWRGPIEYDQGIDIRRISSNTLDGCTGLTSMTIDMRRWFEDDIPAGLLKDCIRLKEINITNSDYYRSPAGSVAILYYNKLVAGCKNTVVPNDVTIISSGAFAGCRGLGEITIPSSVTLINKEAFRECNDLKTVTVCGNVSNGIHIETSAFAGCSNLASVTVKSGSIMAKDYSYKTLLSAFAECSSLTEVIFEEGVTSIGGFGGCTKLRELTIPNSAKKIDDQAFSGCTSLVSVTIGGDSILIGSYAFENCTALTNVTIEKGKKITNYYLPFSGCSNLRSMTVRGPVISDHFTLFDNTSMPDTIYIEDVNTWCNSSMGIHDLNSDAIIKRYHLFMNGKEVEHLKIPEGVTTIADYAFVHCASLKSVIIPNSMTSIGRCAFFNCDSLLLVMSPLENPCAFGGNREWSVDLYYAEPDLPDNYTIFRKYDNYCVVKKDLLTAYVPLGTITTYEKTIGWDKFPNILDWVPIESPDPEKLYPAPHHTPLAIITANSYTIEYGEELPTFEYTSKGDVFNGTPEISCEATNTSPVGFYPIVISKGSIAGARVSCINGMLTITKAPLTVKAGSYTKKAGEENPAFTLTYDGFKNGETEAVLTKQPTVSCPATIDSPVGDYDVIVGGAEAANYDISYVNGKLNVTGSEVINTDDMFETEDGVLYQILSDNTASLYSAQSVEADSYTIPSTVFVNGKAYTVTEIGESAFYSMENLISITIPNTVKAIRALAFACCSNLHSVSISDLAAWLNIDFESNPLTNASHLYVNGEEINDLEIPDGVQSIGNSALYGFKGLHSLIIPNSVTSVGHLAFGECDNLTSIKIGSGVTSIGYNAFVECPNLRTVVSEITDPFAIENCLLFTVDVDENEISVSPATLYVPEGTADKYLQIDAWRYFENIVEGNRDVIFTEEGLRYKVLEDGKSMVTGVGGDIYYMVNADRTPAYVGIKGTANIPSTVNHNGVSYSVTKIDNNAFYGCTKLESVSIPGSVQVIGKEAFIYCYELKNVTIEDGVAAIEDYAFFGCNKLESVVSYIKNPFELHWPTFSFAVDYGDRIGLNPSHATLYVPVGTVDEYVKMGWALQFAKTSDNKNDVFTFTNGKGLQCLLNSNNTVAIANYGAVEGVYEIPQTVTYEGVDYSVTVIAAEAFKGNVGMTEVTIPKTVTSIGSGAFAGCLGLTAIYVYATEPANLSAAAARTRAEGSLVFEGVDKENCVLYVPKGCVEKYRAAEGWGEFTHIVEMDEGTSIGGLLSDGEVFDVYDISGRKVRTAVSSLEGLPKGIYIVNGKKVMK